MSDKFLEKDFSETQIKLYRQKRINQLLKIFTLGIFNNDKIVAKFQLLLLEKKNNLDKYNELENRTENLANLRDTDKLNDIRMGKNTHSDIPVIGREDYGNDWEIIRAEILSRDNHRCQESDGYCSGALQVHHITALTKGGTNQSHNLITLCLYHHSLKHEHMKRNL